MIDLLGWWGSLVVLVWLVCMGGMIVPLVRKAWRSHRAQREHERILARVFPVERRRELRTHTGYQKIDRELQLPNGNDRVEVDCGAWQPLKRNPNETTNGEH